jgi:pimeloyl-ACP methyl ester carboxylesterase
MKDFSRGHAIRQILLTLCLFAIALGGAFAQQATRPADQFFDSNGVQIRYVEVGGGEPLLLIHGFSVTTEFQWGSWLNKLAEDFHVIAFDARGHGKSGKPHGAENYGPEMVEDAIRLLDHLGIEKAHVMGYSMGAAITLNLVANHPERVTSAIVGGNGWTQADSEMEGMIEALATGLENGQGIKSLIIALTPPGQEPMPEQQLEQFNAMAMAANDPLALASVARGFTGFTIPREKLAANEVPTTIIIGTADPMIRFVPPAVEVMPNLQVVELEGDNHMTAPRNPDYYTAALAFFNGEDPHAALAPTEVATEAESVPGIAGH